eukprot:TCONS_00058453-protein
MAKKPISLEDFQDFSINSFAKTKTHPKSPYDPITMKTLNVPLSTYQSQIQVTTSAENNTPTKLSRKHKKKRKVDTTTFLGSDEEHEESTGTAEETIPEETPPRPKKTSTPLPSPCNHDAELKKANKKIEELSQKCKSTEKKCETFEKRCETLESKIENLQSTRIKKKKLKASNKAKTFVRKSVKIALEDGMNWDLSDGK